MKLRYAHARSDDGRRIRRHVLVAERAFGGPLPKGAIVHHIDLDETNDAKDNLVVCEDQAYHKLLHLRTRALQASGHADWRKCYRCKQHSPASELSITRHKNLSLGQAVHRVCAATAMSKLRRQKGVPERYPKRGTQ